MTRHNWQPLYTRPTDHKFLEVWNKNNLASWWQCSRCKLLGRSTAEGKVKPEPVRKRERRLADAAKWNDSVQTFLEADRT